MAAHLGVRLGLPDCGHDELSGRAREILREKNFLGEAAVGAARTDTFLGERYRRIARRRQEEGRRSRRPLHPDHRLAPAVDPKAKFHDLGPGFYDGRIGPDRKKRNHVPRLEALGYKVTLEPVA